MGSVNNLNPNVDLTVRVFDDFYNFAVSVPAEEYDLVNSYFQSVFTDKTAADNFTATLFRIADESNIPVMTLLDQIKDQGQIELTATMAYYLNGLRSPSTLLGLNQAVTPNQYAARNVLP